METNKLQPITEAGLSTISISLPESLQAYSPVNISKTFSEVKTVEHALSVEAPCFGLMVSDGQATREQIRNLVMAHLVVLDAFLKQKDGLTVDEIELIAEEVVDKYPSFSFADIYVIFREAKLGKFGELYNRLSCANVMKWFEDYFDRRCETAYQRNLSADRKQYGVTQGHDSDDVLIKLGYTVKDGRIVIDKEKIAQINAQRAEESNKKKQKLQSEIDKDNDYIKWKNEYMKNGTL